MGSVLGRGLSRLPAAYFWLAQGRLIPAQGWLIFDRKWWQDSESNRGHEDFQSSALPTELSCRMKMNGSHYVAAKLSDKPFRRSLCTKDRKGAEWRLVKLSRSTSQHEVNNP
jgi:hypothetical protein